MRHQLFATFALAVFAGALAACSPAPTAPPTSTTNAPAVSTAPVVSASATAVSSTAQPTGAVTSAPAQPSAIATSVSAASPTKAPASVPFPGPAGLEQLDSYEMMLRVSFKGTRNGQTVNSTDFYTRSVSLNPSTQFTTIQTVGDDGKPDIMMSGLVDNVRYTRTGLGDPCTAQTASSAGSSIFNPVVLLKPFLQGKEIGSETVNGLPARHYVMETLRNAETEMSGDVWIAEKNAFAVKYSALIKGGESYFGKGNKGEQTIAYELSNVGAKKAVAIPSGCLPPVTDMPAMQDAANVKRSLLELSYTTPSGTEKAAAFYQERMKSLGWTLESIPTALPTPPAGGPSVPGLPQLPPVPGVDLGQLLSNAVPTVPAPALQNSWMVFSSAKEQRYVYVTIQREGTGSRVLVEIVQQ